MPRTWRTRTGPSTSFTAAVRTKRGPEDRAHAEVQLDYAHRHRDIIKRFGRYPHRNEALGASSSEDRLNLLKTPGSSF